MEAVRRKKTAEMAQTLHRGPFRNSRKRLQNSLIAKPQKYSLVVKYHPNRGLARLSPLSEYLQEWDERSTSSISQMKNGANYEEFVSKGKHRAEDINRAKILLKADDGLTDTKICEHVGCSIGTPHRTRKAYSERGIAAIHRRKPDRDYEPKLDGRAGAHLIALACSEPPDGRTRWTYALLADRLVTLEEIEFDSISEETVRQRVKNDLKPHRSEYWLIPPTENAEFVYRMEMLLSLYQEPYDETRPVICFDESCKELRKHVRDPLPAAPGAVARTDHHYERNGKRMLHLATEPLTGRCRLHVTERRRTCEWIDGMVAIADDYPDADCIRVVLDNLSTHNPAAFYRFFPPEKAREYLDRFEFYYTPTHGIWLNMAELVWSTLQTQCLNRRIPDAATLRSEVAAWETARNEMDVTVNWQFTNDDARTKLHRLYPSIEEVNNLSLDGWEGTSGRH